ncbi:MAG: hypothetical protein HQ522_16045 [Bacteroidetes bacterium]|nr:hypothetical protein [Bacteroidota bacterium]
MLHRLVICLKGWGTGIVFMCFPILFFKGEFLFGAETWKMLVSLFFVLFPVLFLFENVFYRFPLFSKRLQFIVLSFLFILSEIVFFYLPWRYSQVEYLGSWLTKVTLAIFAVFAAYVVSRFLIPKRNLIIVQKEI